MLYKQLCLRSLAYHKWQQLRGKSSKTPSPSKTPPTHQRSSFEISSNSICVYPNLLFYLVRNATYGLSRFSVIEVAFDEIRPEYRKNFSNYAPVINHLLELLDDPEADALMKHFPKLKSKDKHLDQEVLWEKACNRVKWQ